MTAAATLMLCLLGALACGTAGTTETEQEPTARAATQAAAGLSSPRV